MKHLIVLALFIAFTYSDSYSQRFGAGLIAGLNVAQLDGDLDLGYHKIGLNAGAMAVVHLADRWDVGFELLYSQRGSSQSFLYDNGLPRFKVKLNYIEVPLLIHFKDWRAGTKKTEETEEIIDDGFWRMDFHAGLSYGRLMQYKVESDGFAGVAHLISNPDRFELNNISWIAGASFFFTKNVAMNVRFTQSLTVEFDASKWGANAYDLRGRHLTLGAWYVF